MSSLFLTTNEQALFKKLPEPLQLQWQPLVELELDEVHETQKELLIRRHISPLKEDNHFKSIINTLQNKQPADVLIQEDISAEVLLEICFVLGTQKISDIIVQLLKANADEALDLAADLSVIRHKMFVFNSSSRS